MNFPVEAFNLLEHMRPHIRISPFCTELFSIQADAAATKQDFTTANPERWLNGARAMSVFSNGRTALKAAVDQLGLNSSDIVTIVTTTGGDYVSSCVTKAIEQVCRWSMEIRESTRAILVIHEFGFPCSIPFALKDLHLPIIEDCAYAMGTRLGGGNVGIAGDYAVYSLSKYSPVPFGGFLVSRETISADAAQTYGVSSEAKGMILAFLENCVSCGPQWNKARRENWRFFEAQLNARGFKAYFELSDNVVPGTFVARLPRNVSGAMIKQRCVDAGIESTEYYGRGGFYFPVHQFLNEYDRAYILRHFVGEFEA